ncbi:MAG TPA: class I adenylate cyclase [Gammaproteobacteria bacterium]
MFDSNTTKKRFLALNRDHLMRTADALRSRQRDFFDILPLLFHANHPTFPGFITKHTPAGVSDYSPTNRSLETAKKLVRSFEYKKRALSRYDILSMFLMGSSGSIAYSEDSDFDIWLCHRPELNAEQLKELQKKATAIEEWAATFDVETHFFLMNVESFRKGEQVELSVESSGSAQHYLLLEEFYRTGILLAGRYPIWWLVPPEEESNYDKYVHDLKRKRFIRDNEAIDFGGIPRAPVEEFFGAALWQIYKGIDSPYKSVLKLMLMEAYANEYPDTDLICLRFKQAIQDGMTDIASIDPYVMLYRKVEEYLLGCNDTERLEVVRRCFYFKVNEHLGSPDNPKNVRWQREVMKEVTRDWGWSDDYFKLLDARPTWKIQRVIEERKSLVNVLTTSYQFLSNFARKHAELAKINQRDMNILGRKLYAAFERKTGKIEIVNRGISDNILETHLSIHQMASGGQSGWVLYKGIVNIEDTDSIKPLKRAHNILELIAWCFLNRLMDGSTAIALYTRDSILTLRDVGSIIRCLHQLYPDGELKTAGMEELSEAPRFVNTALFINVGIEPLMTHIREGKHLTTNQTDALSYGGVRENLVLVVDQILQTTWQEVMAFRYEGAEGLMRCLSNYILGSPPSQGRPPPRIITQCFTTGRGAAIASRVSKLFDDVVNIYYSKSYPLTTRYVLRFEHIYFVLYLDKDKLDFDKVGSGDELIRYCAEPSATYRPVVFDRHAQADSILALIYRFSRPDVIQLFYRQAGHVVDIYVVDERGSLFFQCVDNFNIPALLNQYKRFFNSVTYRQNIQISGSPAETAPKKTAVEFYQIVTKKSGKSQLVRSDMPSESDKRNFFNIQVIGDFIDDGKAMFSIYCDEKEFTSLEYGEQVYDEVARHVLERRKSGLHYPIYITDIDLPRTLLGNDTADHVQTIHFLNYKRNIEERLNAALAGFAEQPSARAL